MPPDAPIALVQPAHPRPLISTKAMPGRDNTAETALDGPASPGDQGQRGLARDLLFELAFEVLVSGGPGAVTLADLISLLPSGGMADDDRADARRASADGHVRAASGRGVPS